MQLIHPSASFYECHTEDNCSEKYRYNSIDSFRKHRGMKHRLIGNVHPLEDQHNTTLLNDNDDMCLDSPTISEHPQLMECDNEDSNSVFEKLAKCEMSLYCPLQRSSKLFLLTYSSSFLSFFFFSEHRLQIYGACLWETKKLQSPY